MCHTSIIWSLWQSLHMVITGHMSKRIYTWNHTLNTLDMDINQFCSSSISVLATYMHTKALSPFFHWGLRPPPGPFQHSNSISIVIQIVCNLCNCHVPPKLQLRLLWLGPCMGPISICNHLQQNQEVRILLIWPPFCPPSVSNFNGIMPFVDMAILRSKASIQMLEGLTPNI